MIITFEFQNLEPNKKTSTKKSPFPGGSAHRRFALPFVGSAPSLQSQPQTGCSQECSAAYDTGMLAKACLDM